MSTKDFIYHPFHRGTSISRTVITSCSYPVQSKHHLPEDGYQSQPCDRQYTPPLLQWILGNVAKHNLTHISRIWLFIMGGGLSETGAPGCTSIQACSLQGPSWGPPNLRGSLIRSSKPPWNHMGSSNPPGTLMGSSGDSSIPLMNETLQHQA